MTLRILLGLDLLAASVAVFFFFAGLADGSVSSFNGGLWAAILLAVAAVVAGGLILHGAGWPRLANAVLALLAVPTALYGVFLAVVVLSGESWN